MSNYILHLIDDDFLSGFSNASKRHQRKITRRH